MQSRRGKLFACVDDADDMVCGLPAYDGLCLFLRRILSVPRFSHEVCDGTGLPACARGESPIGHEFLLNGSDACQNRKGRAQGLVFCGLWRFLTVCLIADRTLSRE